MRELAGRSDAAECLPPSDRSVAGPVRALPMTLPGDETDYASPLPGRQWHSGQPPRRSPSRESGASWDADALEAEPASPPPAGPARDSAADQRAGGGAEAGQDWAAPGRYDLADPIWRPKTLLVRPVGAGRGAAAASADAKAGPFEQVPVQSSFAERVAALEQRATSARAVLAHALRIEEQG